MTDSETSSPGKVLVVDETKTIDVPLNIDWPLLRWEKSVLLQVRDESHGQKAEALDGLLNLLDYIQDYAVAYCGVSGEEVFGVGEEAWT